MIASTTLTLQRKDEGLKGVVPVCENIAEWQRLPLSQIQGMRVRRPIDPERFQQAVDELVQNGRMGEGNVVRVPVQLSYLESLGGFGGIIKKLLAPLGLPLDLEEMVQADCCSIGEEVVRLLPDVANFGVSLELLSENVCNRFHVDNYVGRAIVSYNCVATEYVEPWNVNWAELEHCGVGNDDVVIRKDEVRHVDVGDVLFIMGAHFSPGKKALVHKAPDPTYKDGNARHRFVLKVDADRRHVDMGKLIVKQVLPEDKGKNPEFTIELVKTDGERVGLQVDETDGVRIMHISPGGLFDRWNIQMNVENPDLVVKHGYSIISVNGVEGSSGMQLIVSNNELRFKISRLTKIGIASRFP